MEQFDNWLDKYVYPVNMLFSICGGLLAGFGLVDVTNGDDPTYMIAGIATLFIGFRSIRVHWNRQRRG